MCLSPNIMKNKRYTWSKKNLEAGAIPECPDRKVIYTQIPCGQCKECLSANVNQWSMRIFEEMKVSENAVFVTLTFNDEWLERLKQEAFEKQCNRAFDTPRQSKKSREWNENKWLEETAILAIHYFRERYRYFTKKSIRHWCIAERGEKKGRLHIHGILFNVKKEWYEEAMIESRKTNGQDVNSKLAKTWKYGHIWVDDAREETPRYVTKYTMKPSSWGFRCKTLVSPGIGKSYITDASVKIHKTKVWDDKLKGWMYNTKYMTKDGKRVSLAKYYRHKIYTEEERLEMWLQRINAKIFKYREGEIYGTKENAGEILSDMIQKKSFQLKLINVNLTSKMWEEWIGKVEHFIRRITHEETEYWEVDKMKENKGFDNDETGMTEDEIKHLNKRRKQNERMKARKKSFERRKIQKEVDRYVEWKYYDVHKDIKAAKEQAKKLRMSRQRKTGDADASMLFMQGW